MIPEETIPEEIFHYTKMETALLKILSEKKLRLSQMGLTNDPRESKPWNIPKPSWLNPDSNHKSNQNILVAKVLDREVPKVMKEEWKVLCFTLEHSIPGGVEDPLEQLQTYYFNHGYAHPRMWAQYAENHKGVCLWFDGKKLDENLHKELGKRSRIFRHNVRYDIAPGALVIPPLPRTIIEDIDELGPKNAARKYVFEHYEQFFLRKHSDWETEAEYRWLVHSPKKAPEFVSIQGAIKGILVGVDFPKEYKPSLCALCKDLMIPAGQLTWQNGVPTAELENIYKP